MIARLKNAIQKPKVYLTQYIDKEPPSAKEARKCLKWVEAMNDEYKALMKNDTLDLVPIPHNKRIIGYKWIFKIKKNSDMAPSQDIKHD